MGMDAQVHHLRNHCWPDHLALFREVVSEMGDAEQLFGKHIRPDHEFVAFCGCEEADGRCWFGYPDGSICQFDPKDHPDDGE